MVNPTTVPISFLTLRLQSKRIPENACRIRSKRGDKAIDVRAIIFVITAEPITSGTLPPLRSTPDRGRGRAVLK